MRRRRLVCKGKLPQLRLDGAPVCGPHETSQTQHAWVCLIWLAEETQVSLFHIKQRRRGIHQQSHLLQFLAELYQGVGWYLREARGKVCVCVVWSSAVIWNSAAILPVRKHRVQKGHWTNTATAVSRRLRHGPGCVWAVARAGGSLASLIHL